MFRVLTESAVRIQSSIVKSSSPIFRPGVPAGSSMYWSLPLKRSAEPASPGTRSAWKSGSSKVNQADKPAGTGAQRGCAEASIATTKTADTTRGGIRGGGADREYRALLVDQRE